ncbi:MAG: efflux RND transporter periplasmic adaptor subunit [Deltaproteobacteria bacterium]|nr:efflux RND transporter periplasmic adaptor subunit [Deltaproteobacteria bacterium]
MVASVTQQSVPVQVRVIGIVEAYSSVSVRSQVNGTLMRVHFKEGQDVKKEDLLFTIDPRPFEATLKQAEANLAKNSALVENAREQARRYAELVKKQYVSQEQYDQIRYNANALEAVVEADKAALENAKLQLSYCYIYSSMVGRTGSLLVYEGNFVRVNDNTPLVIINQTSPIYVSFSVPEQNLPEIKRRMAAGKLAVEALIPQNADRPDRGELSFVDNTVDRVTGTIKLKGTFANNEKRLWPGQFVKVALTLAVEPNALVVPSQAVQTGQKGQHVFVVKPDLAVELRPVVVSRTDGGQAVIEKGLKPGEKVVTDGQFLLGPGARVEVKGEVGS